MTKKETLDSILKMAETVNKYIGLPGAGAAITIGKAAVEMLDKSKEAFEEKDVKKLMDMRTKLAAKVQQHAMQTEASLR